jgi:hypothetical protein
MNDIFEKSMDVIMIKEKEITTVSQKLMNDFNYCFKRCILILIKKIMTEPVYNKLKSKLKETAGNGV